MVDPKYSLYDMENIKRAKSDSDYLGALINENMNLIRHSINKYVNTSPNFLYSCGVTQDDLLQVGSVGFIKALRAFDTERGIKFSSFATIAISREVKHYLRSNYSVMKISRGAQQLMIEMRDIEAELGELPSTAELAVMLNVSEKRLKQVQQVSNFMKSIEEVNNQNMCCADTLESGDNVDLNVEDKIYLENLIDAVKDKLTTTELTILKLQLSGNNQSDTAKDMGISNMKVSRTIQKIREILKEMNLGKDGF
jgi:RNA polymerase sporulation-specific sigma factor